MRTIFKITLGIVGLLFAIGLISSAFGGGGDKAPAAAPQPPIRLIASKSFCLQDPANAKLRFYLTVRNPASVAQDVDARPWRRYSDNSVNESVIDTVTMTVPPGKTQKFRAAFGYNAEEHTVLECGLYFNGKATVRKIKAL